jgi:hypothetical protein
MRKPINVIIIYVFILLIIYGCATAPLKNQPRQTMQQFTYYERITVFASRPPWTKTNIIAQKGDIIIFFASGEVSISPNRPMYSAWQRLVFRIGKNMFPQPIYSSYMDTFDFAVVAEDSGKLELAVHEWRNHEKINYDWYQNNTGSFLVDIFVIDKNKEEIVPDLLNDLAQSNPQDHVFKNNVEKFIRQSKLYFAAKKTKKEITETKEEIQQIAKKFESEDKAVISSAQNELEIMKVKLAQLTEQLEHLGKLKKEYEAKDFREKDLLAKLERANQRPPIVFIGSPKAGLKAEYKKINLYGVVEDDKAIEKIEFYINGELNEKISKRDIFATHEEKSKRIEFNEKIVLKNGENTLLVKTTDSDGFTSEKEVVVSYTETRKNIWAVVIGINNYQNVRHLKYATKDAKAFYNYLVKTIRIPEENVSLLLNNQAHLYEIRSVLGTHLKRNAGKDDMVMIFFAGHGATEEDSMSPDGDGLEKYILPYDADLKNLYASALPMSEISKIFSRIYSERLIFIADACYSGASGGRTIGINGKRANISDAFIDRISSGKGRVIITASGANEISAEYDELKHGVFTYYMLEALKGKGDLDKDGIITVDEVYNYVSINVPLATGQSQHPVKKGAVEGQLIMGIVE